MLGCHADGPLLAQGSRRFIILWCNAERCKNKLIALHHRSQLYRPGSLTDDSALAHSRSGLLSLPSYLTRVIFQFSQSQAPSLRIVFCCLHT